MAKATCTWEDCARPLLAQGLCRAHYQRWNKHGDPGRGGPLRNRKSSRCGYATCDELVTGGGYCSLHYQRSRKTGSPDGVAVRARPDAERFWAHVNVGGPDECWPWTLARDWQGYGRTKVNGRETRASRAAWRLFNHASILPGFVVRHRCDNPPCCNPAHLELGTHADNSRDRDARGRTRGKGKPLLYAAKRPYPYRKRPDARTLNSGKGPARGEMHPSVRLSDEQVLAIRARLTGQRGELAALAREFGVSAPTIAGIRDRKRLAEVDRL